jgi:hypothetical protein
VFDWPEMSESDLTGRGDPSHQSDRITLVLIGGNKKPNELIPLVKALHIEVDDQSILVASQQPEQDGWETHALSWPGRKKGS